MKTIRLMGKGWLVLLALVMVLGIAVQAGAADKFRIQVLGDSLSYNTWPGYCNGNLESNLSQYEWEWREHALPGYTTGMIMNAYSGRGWRGENPDIVIILAGTNDMVRAQGMDLDAGTSTAVSNIERMVDTATWENTEGRPRVIVSAIPPSWYNSITEQADYYNQRLYDVLKNYGVDVFVQANWDDFKDSNTGQARTDIFADYLHPTSEGYQDMAYNFYQAIDALFNKDRYKNSNLIRIMPNYKSLGSPSPAPTPTPTPTPTPEPTTTTDTGTTDTGGPQG